NARHIDAARLVDAVLVAERLDEILGYFLIADAEQRTLHHTVLLEVYHHFLYDCARNGERIAHIGSGLTLNQRVDADQLAARIDQRAPAVAGIDRRIGLDERFHAVLIGDGAEVTRLGAHDACRNGRLQVERTADGQHPFAQPQRIRIPERQGRQPLAVYLDERHLRSVVRTDDLGLERPPVVKLDLQFGRIVHDVVVG